MGTLADNLGPGLQRTTAMPHHAAASSTGRSCGMLGKSFLSRHAAPVACYTSYPASAT